MSTYTSILDTIGNTPAVRLNRMAPDDVELFVKIEAANPITISEKYSAGPNLSAMFAIGGPNAAITSVATVPAKKDPIADAANAAPARPFRAI